MERDNQFDNAVMSIPPTCSRDEWFKVISSIKTKYGVEGYSLAFAYTQKRLDATGKGKSNKIDKIWDNINPGIISAGTAIFIARYYGWDDFYAPAPNYDWKELDNNHSPFPVVVEYFCQALTGDITLQDFYNTKIWILAEGKKPAIAVGGCWKQSRDLKEGGVNLARYGGWFENTLVRPWTTLDNILQIYKDLDFRLHNREEVKPAVSFAGDKKTPAEHDFIIIDCDYKPERDTDNQALEAKKKLGNFFAKLNMPIFASNSGNGFHALARWKGVETDEWLSTRYPLISLDTGDSVLALDIYQPGRKSLIALNYDRQITKHPTSHILPLIAKKDLEKVKCFRG